MIPLLLWRCPLCAANDALTHTARWPRRERVDCARCGARWSVRRVVGDNFYLKLNGVEPPLERSITDWYAAMKKTIRLEAVADSQADLRPGEILYLASRPAELWAEPEDTPGGDAPAREQPPIRHGRLFLTDQRLIWRGEQQQSFPLEAIRGAYTILTLGIALNCGQALLVFRLPGESPLKWVTYLSLAGGGRLATSHF